MNSAIGADSSAGSTADIVEQRSRSRNYRAGYVDCIPAREAASLPGCGIDVASLHLARALWMSLAGSLIGTTQPTLEHPRRSQGRIPAAHCTRVSSSRCSVSLQACLPVTSVSRQGKAKERWLLKPPVARHSRTNPARIGLLRFQAGGSHTINYLAPLPLIPRSIAGGFPMSLASNASKRSSPC